VDDAEILDRSRGLGVDAIYTNRPRELKALISEG
jgi:hypothetical protein